MERELHIDLLPAVCQLQKLALEIIAGQRQADVGQVSGSFSQQIDRLVLQFQAELRSSQLLHDLEAGSFMEGLQSALIEISDSCQRQVQTALAKNASSDLEILQTSVNRLLSYLISDYDFCFNFSQKAPVSFREFNLATIEKRWQELQDGIGRSMDGDMLLVLEQYHKGLKSEAAVSFYNLEYHRILIGAIAGIGAEKPADLQGTLISTFCYLNFNYYPMVQLLIAGVQLDYDRLESYREEFIRLTIRLRTFSQLVTRPNFGYDLRIQGLKQILCHAVEREITCVKKLLNINLKGLRGSGTKLLLQQFYFRISISMEQFLFIFRLMIDKGIVVVKRKADLYEFIHSHVGTAKKDSLSIGNMQNTYAENNRTTAIRVRALLQSLVALIDEKYLSLALLFSFF